MPSGLSTRHSIRITIALWSGICLTLLAAALIVYSSINLAGTEKAFVQNGALQIAQAQARIIESQLRHVQSTTHALAAVLAADKEAGIQPSREEVSVLLKRALVDNPGLVNTYTSWQPGVFDTIKDEKYGDWFWLWWTRQNGQIIPVTDNTDFKTDSSYDYYTCPQKTLQDCMVEPYQYTEPTINKVIWLATIASPILVNGQMVGIVSFDVQVDFFQSLMDSSKVFDGAGKMAVISYQGNLLGATGKADLFGQPLAKWHPTAWKTELASIQSGKDVITNNGSLVSVFTPISIGNTPWSLNLDVPVQKINQAVTSAVLQMILVGLGLTLIALLLMVLVTGRQIARPIVRLSQAAQRIACGDLDVSVAIQSRDELGQMGAAFKEIVSYLQELSRAAERIADGDLSHEIQLKSEKDTLGSAFNRMAQTLRTLIGKLSEHASKLDDSSKQLAQAAGQSEEATSQIAATIQQVAQGITQQTGSISKTARSAEQMDRAISSVARGAQEQSIAVSKASDITLQINKAIEQVAANANKSAREASQAAETARGGASIVQETIRGMQSIKSKVGISAEKVQEMGKRSDQIGAIVGTIDDIASQTNLLALNAAIEAARAGEHGKGFAVVADEVRKLAERSSIATKEIGALIKNIQQTVAEAVMAMEAGAKEVEQGVLRASQSDEALSSILKAAEAVNRQVEEIAQAAQHISLSSNDLASSMESVSAVTEENTAATEQMTAHSSEVTSSVENIASVSEENSAAVEEVSASTEEITAEVAEVTNFARNLNAMAQDLKGLVGEYKI
ncbi:MAG: methyl-accepting chemotaxis protein [Anaerolineaceae bacterium]|nr:methyl-accepting chemotaxis protein [Anaerolineaceae bacterium]